MLNSLNNQDKIGFENSFGQYLSGFPYSTHEAHEAHYHALFQSAMLLAGADIITEGSVGDGRYDASYIAPDGTVFVFELKYCPLKGPDGVKFSKEEESKLKMEKSAIEAMKQINETNYTKPFKGIGSPIYKVALVVGGRTEVLAVFEKEDA
jgi:hypothetical protein